MKRSGGGPVADPSPAFLADLADVTGGALVEVDSKIRARSGYFAG